MKYVDEYAEAVEWLRERFGDDEEGFEAEMERIEWALQFVSDGFIAEPRHPFWHIEVGQHAREDWIRWSKELAEEDGNEPDDPWNDPEHCTLPISPMPHIPFDGPVLSVEATAFEIALEAVLDSVPPTEEFASVVRDVFEDRLQA